MRLILRRFPGPSFRDIGRNRHRGPRDLRAHPICFFTRQSRRQPIDLSRCLHGFTPQNRLAVVHPSLPHVPRPDSPHTLTQSSRTPRPPSRLLPPRPLPIPLTSHFSSLTPSSSSYPYEPTTPGAPGMTGDVFYQEIKSVDSPRGSIAPEGATTEEIDGQSVLRIPAATTHVDTAIIFPGFRIIVEGDELHVSGDTIVDAAIYGETLEAQGAVVSSDKEIEVVGSCRPSPCAARTSARTALRPARRGRTQRARHRCRRCQINRRLRWRRPRAPAGHRVPRWRRPRRHHQDLGRRHRRRRRPRLAPDHPIAS